MIKLSTGSIKTDRKTQISITIMAKIKLALVIKASISSPVTVITTISSAD
jgi:hypothetical protein